MFNLLVEYKFNDFLLKNGVYINNNISVLALKHPSYVYQLYDVCNNKELIVNDFRFCDYLKKIVNILDNVKLIELCMHCEKEIVKYFSVRRYNDYYISSPLFAYCDKCVYKAHKDDVILKINFRNFAKYDNDEKYGAEFRKDIRYLFRWAYIIGNAENEYSHIGRKLAQDFLFGLLDREEHF